MLSYQVTKEHVWVGAIPDRPGALAAALQALSAGGLNLELIFTQREMPGRALLFVSPLRTIEEVKIAEQAGLSRDNSLHTVRIEGPNVPGLAARITRALAEADIGIATYTAAAMGGFHVTNIAFEHPGDVHAAKRVLERALGELSRGESRLDA